MAKTYAQFGSDTTRCTRSVNNTKVTASTASQTSAARSDIALSSGKWYVEYQPELSDGGAGYAKWGVCLDATSTSSIASNAANLIGGGNANDQTTTAWRRIAVDVDAGKVWVDNVGTGWSGGGDPVAGTTPTATFTAGSSVRIAVRLGAYYNYSVQEFNFGASAFANTVPSGFNSGWYTGSDSTTVTLTPTKGAAAFAGHVPTVARTAHQSLTPAKGAATFTGYVPAVSRGASLSVTPTTGHATFTGNVSTIAKTGHQTLVPTVGHAALAGHAPEVVQESSSVIRPQTARVAFTGYVVTVTQTNHATLTPSVGHTAFVGYAPEVGGTNHRAFTPLTGSLLATGYAPFITQGLTTVVAPHMAHLTAHGQLPTVRQGRGIALDDLPVRDRIVTVYANLDRRRMIIMPGEVDDFAFHWYRLVPENERIIRSDWKAAVGEDSRVEGDGLLDAHTVVRIGAMESGERLMLTNSVLLSNGQLFKRQLIIDAREFE